MLHSWFAKEQNAEMEDINFIIRTRNALVYQQRLYEGLLQRPASQLLHFRLIESIVALATTAKIRGVSTCRARLEDGLKSVLYSLHFLTVADGKTIQERLMSRDKSLLLLFNARFTEAHQRLDNKSADEITALVIQQSDQNLENVKQLLKDKNESDTRRVRKAAERLSILSTSAIDLVDSNVEKLDDNAADMCMCIVCMAAKRQICLVPCGHIALCSNCAIPLQKCPNCRADIQNRIKFVVS